jgi:hypothetical protein
MTLREELQRLVDTLPQGALENARQALQHFQIWPPQPPPELERMRQIRQEQMDRMRRSMQPGTMGGGGFGGTIHPGGYGHSGHSRVEGDTAVNETHHFYKGYELEVTERLRVADNGKALDLG